ncbi:TPA: entry exclusion lipoprotein TrbK [Yersinia enterocolitica]|nr:entry exclusion lipoprotein TrbK [Yersinia enterocolitica]HEI6862787.1 entry exclusion lipoprotein TrbK [Yersinia enterocolitica]
MIIKIGFAVAVLVLSGCDNSKNNQSCSDVRHMEDSPPTSGASLQMSS